MNYKIIADYDRLQEFIEWLPELGSTEKYYLSLFSRKKYDPESGTKDKGQLKRFVTDKKRMLNKIEQLQIREGDYRVSDDVPVTQDSLALYINPNPRCMKKATTQLGKACWDLIAKGNYNIHQEAMTCIQQSQSRVIYIDFDIDDTEADLGWIKENIVHYSLIKTRGGYHLLVEIAKEMSRRAKTGLPMNLHQLIREKYKVDNVGDQLLPVPGTFQGGFVPEFIYL